MIHKLMKGLAPVAALAVGAVLAGCSVDISTGGIDGVPLAELDTSSSAPEAIDLVGPDDVTITRGDVFTVDVTGDADAVAAVRFELDNDSLTIGRDRDAGRNLGKATVNVTLPSLRAIAIAGSGNVSSDHLEGDSEISVAGSGNARIATITSRSLDVSIGGSGNVEGSGRVDELDTSIAGSGSIKLEGVRVDNASVAIAGSGDVAFSSDGTVDASIVGSGDVTVIGNADCNVSAVGSGKLRCRPAAADQGDTAS